MTLNSIIATLQAYRAAYPDSALKQVIVEDLTYSHDVQAVQVGMYQGRVLITFDDEQERT
jgi:hypothetical protein